MTLRPWCMVVVLLGLTLPKVIFCQEGGEEISLRTLEVALQEDANQGENDDNEEEEEDAISMLRNVETLDDMLPLLRLNGRQLQLSDIFSDSPDSSGKQTISEGGRLAVPGGCAPRNTTVSLNLENTGSQFVFFPRCTTVERCSGCCASPHLECRSAYTERVSLKVLKARAPFPGSTHLIYHGFAPVIIDRHVRCRVHCTLDPTSCGPNKRFLRNRCTCKCRSQSRCAPPKVWDSEDCACKCNARINCCRFGDTCGLVYNTETCECDLQDVNRISSNVNASEQQMEEYMRGRMGSNPHTPPTQPPTMTATSTTPIATTATTPPATTRDPCAHVSCPGRMIKVVNNGQCVCRPRMRSGGRRRRPVGRG